MFISTNDLASRKTAQSSRSVDSAHQLRVATTLVRYFHRQTNRHHLDFNTEPRNLENVSASPHVRITSHHKPTRSRTLQHFPPTRMIFHRFHFLFSIFSYFISFRILFLSVKQERAKAPPPPRSARGCPFVHSSPSFFPY